MVFLFRPSQLLCTLCLLASGWISCTQAPAPQEKSVFLTRIDSIKTQLPDSLQPVAFQHLYEKSSLKDHTPDLKALLRETAVLLFYQPNADTTLLPFYHHLIADQDLNTEAKTTALLQLASYYAHILGNPDSAGLYVAQAQALSRPDDDTTGAKIWSIQAQIAQLYGNLPKATTDLYEALRHAEKARDTSSIARIRGNRANIYRQLEDYDKAVADRSITLAFFKRTNDSTGWLTAASGLAADYADLRQDDSARHYFKESEMLLEAGIQQPIAQYYLYLSEGGFYVNTHNYDSAIYYFDKATPFLQLFRDQDADITFLISAVRAYAQKRPVPEEARRIAEAIPQLLADSNLATARNAYYTLYMVSNAEKDANSALDAYQLYDSVRMVLSNNENRAHIADLQAHYEAEKRDLTIQLQQKALNQRRTLNVVLGLSALSIILASAIVIYRMLLQRSRQQAAFQQHFTTEMLKHTEAERGRIAIDLHDGISHELLSLKNNLRRTTAESEARIDAILNDIRMLSRNLHPVMLDKIGLEHSVQNLCEQIMEGGRVFASADIDYQKQLSTEGELQLYRIIQESLSNVVKYASALAAKVRITSQPNRLLVAVIDNGKGFDVSGKLASKNAFGLHSILARSEALGGKASFISGNEGTTVTIEIPLA